MTDVTVTADLRVEDEQGDPQPLSVNAWKTDATGAASEETMAQVRDRLVASILTDPVVTASNAVRDRLPAALHADGGLKVHLVNPTADPETGLATEATSVQTRDNVADAVAHLADVKTAVEAAATEAAVQTLLSRVGPQVSGDTLLALLREIRTNTATPIADIASLELTAEQVQLNTDQLETKLDTLIGHVDQVEGNQGTGNTALAAILAKLIAAPATEAKQDTLIGHVDDVEAALASILAKDEQIRALLAGTVLVDRTPPIITATTYDADDNLVAWTQNGVDYEATFDADGNLLTQGLA